MDAPPQPAWFSADLNGLDWRFRAADIVSWRFAGTRDDLVNVEVTFRGYDATVDLWMSEDDFIVFLRALGECPCSSDVHGQAPCPHCRGVLTNEGRVCRECEGKLDLGAPATWVGPELVPAKHFGTTVIVGRGSIVRFIRPGGDGYSVTVTVGKGADRGAHRQRLHFVPAEWLCPMGT